MGEMRMRQPSLPLNIPIMTPKQAGQGLINQFTRQKFMQQRKTSGLCEILMKKQEIKRYLWLLILQKKMIGQIMTQ
ncbi:hypothetical protein FGO68_gene1501 [Halteria grandinella]|uniref:Uncharacterized protein n=1 Tax=Halteria grandinella TaxID=5974 RepID=A0A8J8NLA9_HALGN|nr:hypothetical protein FGO68_gene1501 [Halteria grandinella]